METEQLFKDAQVLKLCAVLERKKLEAMQPVKSISIIDKGDHFRIEITIERFISDDGFTKTYHSPYSTHYKLSKSVYFIPPVLFGQETALEALLNNEKFKTFLHDFCKETDQMYRYDFLMS